MRSAAPNAMPNTSPNRLRRYNIETAIIPLPIMTLKGFVESSSYSEEKNQPTPNQASKIAGSKCPERRSAPSDCVSTFLGDDNDFFNLTRL